MLLVDEVVVPAGAADARMLELDFEGHPKALVVTEDGV